MAGIRRRLRLGAATWLILQVAMLSVLVPRNCCASHQAGAARGCHEERPANFCPMRSADGTPCPMHRDSESEQTCAIRSNCDGPMSAVLVWLSTQGELTRTFELIPNPPVALVAAPPDGHAHSSPTAPDTPPPRA